MKINEIITSKVLKIILIVLGILIIALLIFKLGMFVGAQKALFSCRWAEHYAPNFWGPQANPMRRFFENFDERNLIRPHGNFGKIIHINKDDKTLVIKNDQEPEKIIAASTETIIEMRRQKISFDDLKNDDFVVVIGEPNENGIIEAKIIRLLPDPLKQAGFFNDGRKIF
ncbi:MAG: hypothetical protein ACPLKV_03265 [Minisyncoccia bacterium]